MRTDHFDDLIAAHPGLRALARALTSAGTPRELAGRQAALAMFRQVTAVRIATVPQAGQHRRRRPALLEPLRRAALLGAAGALALCASFTVAGYAAALPAPVQQVAHRLLGFAGVPASGPHGHGPADGTLPPSASSGTAAASSSSAPGSQSGSPGQTTGSGTPLLTLSVARSQIAAGGQVTMTALLTQDGGAVGGATLSLLELSSTGQGWQPAGTAVTDAVGRATLTVPYLAADATFRVSGPGGAASGKVIVTVIPAITVSTATGRGTSVTATVTCPFCAAGDTVELQVLSAGRWQDAHAKKLDRFGVTVFALPSKKTSVSCRVVLPGTASHGPSVSSVITVPAHGGKGGGGQAGGGSGSGGHGGGHSPAAIAMVPRLTPL